MPAGESDKITYTLHCYEVIRRFSLRKALEKEREIMLEIKVSNRETFRKLPDTKMYDRLQDFQTYEVRRLVKLRAANQERACQRISGIHRVDEQGVQPNELGLP